MNEASAVAEPNKTTDIDSARAHRRSREDLIIDIISGICWESGNFRVGRRNLVWEVATGSKESLYLYTAEQPPSYINRCVEEERVTKV